MSRLKMWEQHPSWEQAETSWNKGAEEARAKCPNKGLSKLPQIVGITPDTKKGLKWKSFKWMLTQDHDRSVLKGFLKHPFKYGWRYITSLWKPKSFVRDGDFFYYGIKNTEEFQKALSHPQSLFVMGFSYCHKPLECPSGRFTPECIADPYHSTCRQCFIGKAIHASPKNAHILIIPTVHYIGGKIFELVHGNRDKQVVFMITACELTLEMFGDWGVMAGIKGIGVRLDGRICNTMRAFELSEQGIKPGLTVVLESTQERILAIFKQRLT